MLTDDDRRLLGAPHFAVIATLMPDGSPHTSTVWVDTDGDDILVNTAEGRVKPVNVRRDPRVSLSVVDPENPYRYVEIRGRVVDITQEGADESINQLAKKYLGVDQYPYRQPGEVRVIYRVKPEHVHGNG